MGAFQERITSTRNGSITSIQAVYVPADDMTDPAPATTFIHLDATTVLARSLAAKGIYLTASNVSANLRGKRREMISNALGSAPDDVGFKAIYCRCGCCVLPLPTLCMDLELLGDVISITDGGTLNVSSLTIQCIQHLLS